MGHNNLMRKKPALTLALGLIILPLSSCLRYASGTFVADGSVRAAAIAIAERAHQYDSSVTSESLLEKTGFSPVAKLDHNKGAALFYYAYKDTMPALTGARYYDGYFAKDLTNVGSEAKEAVDFLTSHGLYTPAYENNFAGTSYMTTAEVNTLLDRFSAYYGTNEKDDFFSTINHDYLYENETTKDWTPENSHSMSSIVSAERIVNWTKSILSSGVNDERLNRSANLVTSYSDLASRNDPTKGVLAAINGLYASASTEDLLSSVVTLSKSQLFDPLFSELGPTLISSGGFLTNAYLFKVPDLSALSSAHDFQNDAAYRLKFIDAYAKIYASLGFSSEDAASLGSAFFDYASTTIENYNGITTGPSSTTIDPSETFGSSFSCYDHLTKVGYSSLTSHPSLTIYSGYRWVKATFNSLFSSTSSLMRQKAYLIYNEALHYKAALPFEAFSLLAGSTYTKDNYLDYRPYYNYVIPMINGGVAGYFASTSEYQKELVATQNLFASIKDAFHERIAKATWLSDAAKTASYEKLSKMKYCFYESFDDGTAIAPTSPVYSSASFYDNLILNDKASDAKASSYIGANVGLHEYCECSNFLEANAFYAPFFNGVYVTMGYLASKDRFDLMDEPALLANLGWALGHELTHGFDSNGIDYDADGVYTKSWWGASDHVAYTALKTLVAAYYEGYEVMPGASTPGVTVPSEAIADLGGVALCLDIGAKTTSFDYKAFFTKAAETFAATATRAIYFDKYSTDVHPFGRARVNRCFSTFDVFVKTFGIEPGDGMYVAPLSRVGIW
jgi:putative endopeptidase